MRFAKGKKSRAQCDRCGNVVKYQTLKNQVVSGRLTNLWVCEDCLDEDHPQWRVRFLRVDDATALRHPRVFQQTFRTLPNTPTFDINQPYAGQVDIPERDVAATNFDYWISSIGGYPDPTPYNNDVIQFGYIVGATVQGTINNAFVGGLPISSISVFYQVLNNVVQTTPVAVELLLYPLNAAVTQNFFSQLVPQFLTVGANQLALNSADATFTAVLGAHWECVWHWDLTGVTGLWQPIGGQVGFNIIF